MTEPADHVDRELILAAHQETLFVEAGAGTGKTTALVARVVHMVATGHLWQIGDLAAITFTENAAAELRSRIREGLEGASRGKHLLQMYDEVQRARCRTALGSLEDAVITTLHSFSARILGEAPIEADLQPGFSVADTMTSSVSADDAWRGFLDELLDDQVVRPQLLAGLTIDPRILQTMHDIAGAMSGSWDRLIDHPLQVHPLPRIHGGVVIGALREALKHAGQWPSDDPLTTYLEGSTTTTLKALETATDPMDVLEILTQRSLGTGAGRAPVWTKVGLNKKEVIAALAQAEDARRELLDAVGAAVTETLAARVQDWVLEEAGRRRDEGSLDFHDLLVFARDLLRDNPSVRARLHKTWPVLMVDEFQDTDPLQVEIVHLLAATPDDESPDSEPRTGREPKDWAAMPVEEGRLFFVGDAKQSIFRFRRADIDTFRAVGLRYRRGQRALTVNFRSVPGVIDAANAVFKPLIGDDPNSGIDYSALQTFRADVSPNHGSDTSATVPVRLLGGPQDTDIATVRLNEAEHIADLIVRVKAEGWAVGKVSRQASYGDVAILLPTRTSLGSLERALQGRDVPYRVESRSLVWATDAVVDLVTMLQAIDNPSDEVAVIAALRHPGLACTDVALVEWRAAGGRWNYMADAAESLPTDHLVAAGLSELRRWHEARWWMPVNELVASLVRELRLVELTATQRRPRDHWRRMRFLVDQSRAWCDAGGSGLGGFVDWAVRQIENEADVLETVVPEPDDDAVRILTVHGSKGLEFPITIVSGLASIAGRPSSLVWDETGKPQIRLKKDALETSGYPEANTLDNKESKLESTRLLYVALTRAMDHLVLGCYYKTSKSGQSHAQKVRDLLITSGLAVVDPLPAMTAIPAAAAKPLASGVDGSSMPSLPDRADFAHARDSLLKAVGARVATSPTALVKEAAVKAAIEEAAIQEASDQSIAGEATTGDVAGPKKYPRRGSSKGAAIGTAVHRVLELVDLANPTNLEIMRLAELACSESEVPALVKDVAGRVGTALRADVVQQAGQSGRAWREVYLIVRDGDRFMEGYIDLLVEPSDGKLALVDYKTDRVDSAEDVAAKATRYAPQLAQYQNAVLKVVAVDDVTAQLVFAAPASARQLVGRRF